jgi:hypothetical protein
MRILAPLETIGCILAIALMCGCASTAKRFKIKAAPVEYSNYSGNGSSGTVLPAKS